MSPSAALARRERDRLDLRVDAHPFRKTKRLPRLSRHARQEPGAPPVRAKRQHGNELTVIASVVIGGTSLFGGVGAIFGTVIGTILIGVLLNGLVLMEVSPYIQQIIVGVIIVLAVAFDTFAKSRRRKA